jgi:hypothetical protein
LLGGIALSLRTRSFLLPALALLVVFISALVSARPAAAASCWQRVLADWKDGHIDGTYSPRCLRAAIVNMPEDVKIYGSAEEEITRLLNRAQAERLVTRQIAASTGKAEPSAGSRSLEGRKAKTAQAPARHVAAALKPPADPAGHGLSYRTLLLILAATSAAAVLAFAFAGSLRG